MMKDRIFTQDIGKQFEFDAQVANVFDDMLERSIPHYNDTLALIVDFTRANLPSIMHKKATNTLVYDLGTSTGTTLLALYQALPPSTRLIGIDNSFAMVQKATLKAKSHNANISFLCEDVLHFAFMPCHIVIANYILQFIRPLQRSMFLQKIYNALEDGGVLFVSEKIASTHRILDKQMIERYARYKMEQGYTHNEIAKKREALENVLIPFSLEENIAMLKEVGFSGVEVLYKWVNFSTIIAKK